MQRFEALYRAIEPGRPVWDIGCDHGLLGIRALEEGLVPFVNFVDVSKAVSERLARKLSDHNQIYRIWNTRGEDLPWDQVSGSVILAGLGPSTIHSVVSSIPSDIQSKVRLIISSEKNSDDLRVWLNSSGWRLIPQLEAISLERGRFRLIFAVSKEGGEELHPFGNTVFDSRQGVDYLKTLLVLWRDSHDKRTRWPERYGQLLDLARKHPEAGA